MDNGQSHNRQGRWDISVLYSGMDDPALTADLEQARAAADYAATYLRGLAGPDVRRALSALDAALGLCSQVQTFANMVFLTDSTNCAAGAVLESCQTLAAQNERSASVLSRLVQSSGAAEVLAQEPGLEAYSDYFGRQARLAAHLPPAEVEAAMLAMQQHGGHGWARLRGRLEAATTATVPLAGTSQALPIAQVRGLMNSGDSGIRRAAYLADRQAAHRHADAFAACLCGIKGEALAVARLRGFDSVLSWMLSISRMSPRTLAAMDTAVQEALPDFRRFARAKARYLGHSGAMPYYDLTAPLGRTARSFTLPQAGDYLSGLLGKVDATLGVFVQNAFQGRWLDTQPRPGKQGGAMCLPLATKGQSRIFANFDGSLPGVITLAHELGHAWHDRCTFHVPLLLRDAPTPVCETASTFHETVVYWQALAEASGDERLFLLDALLSGALLNILDMRSRYTFEHRLLEVLPGGSPDADALCALMEESQREAYGDSLLPDAMHPYQWLSKVHYYIPNFHYYSFPYTFGLLFSQGLYAQFDHQPRGFFERYSAMLAATCTADVEEAGAIMGIDLGDAAFWRDALRGFGEKIDEFVALCDAH